MHNGPSGNLLQRVSGGFLAKIKKSVVFPDQTDFEGLEILLIWSFFRKPVALLGC
jgi:hypothetical protein